VVPVLIQALKDQSVSVRASAAQVLDSIGTIYPEALEAVKEYRFRQ
jgi:2-hydroxy-3-keto-5-methylthiopentenyl-1-phosphate phosphatase